VNKIISQSKFFANFSGANRVKNFGRGLKPKIHENRMIYFKFWSILIDLEELSLLTAQYYT